MLIDNALLSVLIYVVCVLIGVLGFFLFAFFNRVDKMASDVQAIREKDAGTDEKIKSHEDRLKNIEHKVFKNIQHG